MRSIDDPEGLLDPETGMLLVQATYSSTTAGNEVAFHFTFDLKSGRPTSVMAQPSTEDCGKGSPIMGRFYPSGLSGGRQLMRRFEYASAKGDARDGWIAIDWKGGSPTLGASRSGQFTYARHWRPGPAGVFELNHDDGHVDLDTWDHTSHSVFVGDPEGLPTIMARPVRDGTALIRVWNWVSAGLWAWSEATGAQPIVRTFGDTTQGALGGGTDGTDLVWIRGSGKKAGVQADYPTMDVMTAPYSLDPATVQANTRRLRSSFQDDIAYGFVVGCGYAARRASDAASKFHGVHLVRLADGASWKIDYGPSWSGFIGLPAAVTCTDLYMTFETKETGPRFLQLPISGLGPPIPSD